MKGPVCFIGHGSPMNAIEDNVYTQKWIELANSMALPKGIVVISAHWMTDGFAINNQSNIKTIYDMRGFPQPLYDIVYNASSDKHVVNQIIEHIATPMHIDNHFGYDHGVWSILYRMYPNPTFPIIPISISFTNNRQDHFELGKQLRFVRKLGYMIMATGNIVHNLRLINAKGIINQDMLVFDTNIQDALCNKNDQLLLNPTTIPQWQLSVPTWDHYLPLLVAYGALDSSDQIELFNQGFDLGSISMTSFITKS